MTDAATPEAPKRITRNRPTKYPAQLAVMLEQDMYDDIVRASEEAGVAKADVAREWLREGRDAGPFCDDFRQIDSRACILVSGHAGPHDYRRHL